MKYYLNVLKNYGTFTGRAGRQEYWMFVLFNFAFCILAVILDNATGLSYKTDGNSIGYGYIYTAYVLFTFMPGLSVLVRRLHDVDKSGSFFLIVLIPLAGAIWLLVLLCTESNGLPNRYGKNTELA